MAGAQEGCIDLLRDRLRRSDAAVALAAVSPGTGAFSWSAGALPDGRPVTPRTRMYAGSITKQFVAALVGRTILAGRLEVGASAGRILPALPSWAESVLVRHLVHHTSGLPPTAPLLSVLRLPDEAGLTNQIVLRGLSQLPQPGDVPGRAFAYSNLGYVLLAEILRVVTGTDAAALAHDALITPLGLTGSSIGQGAPYALRQPPPRTIGDGGLWTTATDLLRWLETLNLRLLGEELTELLQTPGHLDDGTVLEYAWGMTVRPAGPGATYTHGGSWPGWTAKTVRNPAAGTALVLLTRHDDARLVSEVAMAMHELLLLG